jgi:hypothetical protein
LSPNRHALRSKNFVSKNFFQQSTHVAAKPADEVMLSKTLNKEKTT